MKPAVLAVCVATLALSWAGCKKSSPAPRTYQVRGVVQHVVGKGESLVVHHEAIDHFVHSDGVAAGMHAMTMTLPVHPKVAAGKLLAGDKIAFEIEVNWDRAPPLLITSLKKLPTATELVFARAKGEHKR